METPRSSGRRTSKVGQNYLRNRLFLSDDSGIGNSPTTGIPHAYSETVPDIRHRRKVGHSSPISSPGRVHKELHVDGQRGNKGNGWKKFWLIWVSFFAVSSSLVATAWTYFPENKVVQKSQEYVMTGLIVILTLVVLTGILKLIFQAFVPRENLNDCHQTWPDNDEDPCHGFHRQSGNTDNAQFINAYESDESPVYPTMEVESSGQKSEIIGQKEQEDLMPDLHNRTNGLSVHKDSGVNTNIKSKAYIQPETNSDVCTQMNKVAFGNSTSEYPVRRTFAGTGGDVWNEFIRYFENISE